MSNQRDDTQITRWSSVVFRLSLSHRPSSRGSAVVGVALTGRLCSGCWTTVSFPDHNQTTSMLTSQRCRSIGAATVVRRKPNCSAIWFDAQCPANRRECQMLERRYRRNRLPCLCRFKSIQLAIGSGVIEARRSIGSVGLRPAAALRRGSGRRCDRDVTGADGFAAFFACKIERVRSDTAGLPPPPIIDSPASSYTSFQSCSQEEVRKILMSSPI
jgi:hypothetical protein